MEVWIVVYIFLIGVFALIIHMVIDVENKKYQELYNKYIDKKSNTFIDKTVIKDSIRFYGPEHQSTICMEECSELIQCISKEKRGKSDINHMAEEIADVCICIEMLKQIYFINDTDICNWISYKQDRLEEMMKK